MSGTKTTAAITAVGAYLPDTTLTNQDLEKMVDTNDEWIVSRTGIRERRILKNEGWAASDMAAEAMKQMLEKRGIGADELDLVIVATITSDYVMPDCANVLCDKIGAVNAYGFDIRAACSGFLFALSTGSKFIESGAHKKVAVVGVDVMSSILNYTDRTTCIIFGDGCGCILLEPNHEGLGIQDAVLKGDGSGRDVLVIETGGSLNPITPENIHSGKQYVYQDGKKVFKKAVNGMVDTTRKVLERNHLTTNDVNWVVPHQANMRIISAVSDELGVPSEKVMKNIEKFGNTTAGTLPICLWEWEPKLKKGDNIILTAFGGGFTWGALLLKWAYDGK